jgi:D-serine deaminase-like pyridoxal phosphate-dependent protein
VLDAAARSRHVTPVGVECFEGVVGEREAVDALLERVAAVGASSFDGRYILSAGGSTFFDAAAELTRTGAEVILRSGCYVVHDHGMYAESSPLTEDPFQPALELWTDVLSCPEPGRAIAGVGRRDAPYDAGLPTVLRAYRGGEPLSLGDATVTELNDQHAFVTADGLRPGDLLCLGISHPCGAFDRWRTLLEVDPDYTVTRAIRTFF